MWVNKNCKKLQYTEINYDKLRNTANKNLFRFDKKPSIINNIIRLVAKLFEHRAKNRALIGKCARENATPSERKNVRGAEGAAHIAAYCLCRVFAGVFAN